ncbi:hypothetical protein KUV50_15775 [Membranicola marinus]|uniref:Uncharacterized protein n=1 Tax=Membranihabitans marinus TaxID=1227546 RepID=A0A953I1K6_9BACT|nr:hypothetical protein [Membranihabitans marinus]MBY5959612.1 hypothetical protein [Membranihabitans marinus]
MNINNLITLLLITFWSVAGFAQKSTQIESSGKNYELRAVAELGFLSVLGHKVQFSKSGTYFDYRKSGGQDVLFPVSRLSLELEVNKKNTFILLYQPLTLESQVLLENDLIVDDLVFPANTGVNLLYNFPFYRASYLRELLSSHPQYDLAVGGSLQIRNATISFESTDGTRFRTNRDVGPVPAFKVRGRAWLGRQWYTEIELDGIYAPVSYLNGSDNEVVGAILDASWRLGLQIKEPLKTFLNLRYLGGGAVGTSDDDAGPGDGYVRNWLNFLTVTAGAVHTF